MEWDYDKNLQKKHTNFYTVQELPAANQTGFT